MRALGRLGGFFGFCVEEVRGGEVGVEGAEGGGEEDGERVNVENADGMNGRKTNGVNVNATEPSMRIRPAANFDARSKATWRKRFDHNHLRITRIIRSLRVLGLDDAAQAFLIALVAGDREGRVSDRSMMFWVRAAERPLHLSPQEEDEGAEGIAWLREVEKGSGG